LSTRSCAIRASRSVARSIAACSTPRNRAAKVRGTVGCELISPIQRRLVIAVTFGDDLLEAAQRGDLMSDLAGRDHGRPLRQQTREHVLAPARRERAGTLEIHVGESLTLKHDVGDRGREHGHNVGAAVHCHELAQRSGDAALGFGSDRLVDVAPISEVAGDHVRPVA
jgi:hypothetical protein